MSYPLGAIRGITSCASKHGIFAVLALDHRQNLRRELRPDAPESVTYDDMSGFKRAVIRALSPIATATLLDPEVSMAQSIADRSLPPGTGLIVALEATGYEGSVTARISRVLEDWSVEKAKRSGASAAKLLIYYHPDASNAGDQERLLESVYVACRAADLGLFVEPLSYTLEDGHPLHGEERRRVVVETARRLTSIGGDILKAEFPYAGAEAARDQWPEACADLDAASQVPWVLLSGGVDEMTFEGQVEAACLAGASGVAVGRSVWAKAATLPPGNRDEFLATDGAARLRRIADLVERYAKPWYERPNRWRSMPFPGAGWFRDY